MFQKLIVVGNLGRDPRLTYLEDGRAMCTFSVGVNYTEKREKKTLWMNVLTFERTAELCNKWIQKGSLVLCEGRLVADSQSGGPKMYARKDGTSGSSFEMVASNVTFLSKPLDKEDEDANPAGDEEGKYQVF